MATSVIMYYPAIRGVPGRGDRILGCGSTVAQPNKAYCSGSIVDLMDSPGSSWEAKQVVNVPANELPTASFEALTSEDEVCNVLMNAKVSDPMSKIPPIWFALLLAFVAVLHVAVRNLFQAKSGTYRNMFWKHQLNVVVYMTSLIWFTCAFVVAVGLAGEYLGTPHASMVWRGGYNAELDVAFAAEHGFTVCSMVAIAMFYEAFAKPAPDAFLLLHHAITLSLIGIFVVGAQRTGQTIFASFGLVLSFHLTTEHPTYVALLLKRFQAPTHVVVTAFKVATISTLVLKPFFFGWAVWMAYESDVWSGLEGRQFASYAGHGADGIFYVLWILLPALVTSLQLVQLVQVKQMWDIAKATERKAKGLDDLVDGPAEGVDGVVKQVKLSSKNSSGSMDGSEEEGQPGEPSDVARV
jgi:hypothetical protein